MLRICLLHVNRFRMGRNTLCFQWFTTVASNLQRSDAEHHYGGGGGGGSRDSCAFVRDHWRSLKWLSTEFKIGADWAPIINGLNINVERVEVDHIDNELFE